MMSDERRRIRWEDVAMTAAGRIRADGIDRLDLDEIAATLGVGPDAIRYWFNDETELLRSIMQIRQRWFLDEADTRLAPLATHTEKLAALLELCVADHDVTYWIELWKLGVRNERARQARQTLAGGYRDLFARLIRAGQRSGEFAAVPPDQVALVLVAMVVGLSVDVTVSDPEDSRGRADAMHAVLVDASQRLLEIELPPVGSSGDSGPPA
jgi:AcrR family transcriptional regulator